MKGAAQFGKDGDIARREHRQCGCQDIGGRQQGRTAGRVPLYEGDPEVANHAQVGRLFDALGDHPAAETLGEPQHGLDRLHLLAVGMNAMTEVAVDLHELRLQFGP